MKMEAIFHEKQEGSLCAQHCLNALLQGEYFTAVDLADIARELDETERQQMAEGGTNTEGYQQFLKQPSHNFDDSGFFSVQVIDKALRVWGLELLPYNSTNAMSQQARASPTAMTSFICNFGEHWLTVRKLGNQWFNLNSLLTGPELISDTYLGMFLTQLQQDGYSIFIVTGDLVETEADQLLRLCPATQPIKPRLISEPGGGKSSQGSGGKQPAQQQGAGGGGESRASDDEEMGKALQESKKLVEEDDVSLQRALQASMEGYIEESVSRIEHACDSPTPVAGPSGGTTPAAPTGPGHTLSGVGPKDAEGSPAPQPSVDEMRQRRLAFLDKQGNNSASGSDGSEDQPKKTDSDTKTPSAPSLDRDDFGASGGLTEEEMLEQAIAMSMSQDT